MTARIAPRSPMAAPASLTELTARLRKSGLVPGDRLDGFLAALAATNRGPATAADLLARLVDAGLLTPFHADRLAAGKYKGFVLGSYLILDQIGAGGMGQVYLAEHATMKRLVALKVLPVFPADSPEDGVARERFLREARAAATLDHPNVVRVFDLCHEGRLMYLVMEYVDGISFQALVARAGPLPIHAAAHYIRQAAFGLQYAHELGFVHRDVKPANLLLDRAGVVKVLDLGLVRSEADAGAGLTQRIDHKSVLGTADYVAPEQAVDSSHVDARADVYSLGATLYFLLTGRPLFPDGRTAQKLVWQQLKDPTPITRLRPDVPAELAAVVHGMLSKKPDGRPPSAAAVFDALAPWAAGPIDPPDPSLLPVLPARAAGGRGGAGPTAAQRSTATTSHMVSAAMRSGTGLSQGGITGGSSGTGTQRIGPRTFSDPDTDVVALDETQRPVRIPLPPGGAPTPAEPPPAAPAPGTVTVQRWQAFAILAGLLLTAGMAVGGLIVLLLRK